MHAPGSRSFAPASLLLGLALAGGAARGRAETAGVQLVGLTEDNRLVLFDSTHPEEVRTVKVTKVSGTLVGIDYRPANGRLYGLSTANNLYTIDPATGVASTVA